MHAHISEGLRVQMVYKRRIPPPSIDVPSSSAPPPAFEPPPVSEHVVQQSSSCFPDGESFTYEKFFPSLVESCKNLPLRSLEDQLETKEKPSLVIR